MIGFIGLGIMGKPMVENLLKHGCVLLVNDIDKDKIKQLEQKGAQDASVAQIGEKCDIIFVSLPNGQIVTDVLLGENGVISTAKKGTIVADFSSITPKQAQACAIALAENGIDYLDCPVSGGEPKAIDGTLSFMIGGNPKAFEAVTPYLYYMGSSAVLVGPSGAGSIAKLSNQIIVNVTIAAVAEAFTLAEDLGVDLEKVFQAIRGGLAGSTVLEMKGPMMIAKDFRPGGTIAINLKDIKNVMDTASEYNIPLPMTSILHTILQSLKKNGHGMDDHSGIIQFYG